MNQIAKRIGIICSVIAFVLCLSGGWWILSNVNFGDSDDAVWTGLGLYFIGKAFFVGPMLLLTALRES